MTSWTLTLFLFYISDWQCIDEDTDYPGYDISDGLSSGIDDCYKKCKDLVNCQSFMIVYNGESAYSLSSGNPLNNCWLKSKKFGNGLVTLAGLQAGNMDCFIGS